ncbi:glucose 1-dehydrogenase [Saccharopolyspora tripterygii]
MSNRLSEKVVLITGAARGQGAAEARLFAENGARLVISDVQESALEELGEELRGKGHQVAECVLDVTSPEAWSTAVQKAETQYGRLNVVVNNAGILTMAGVEDTDLDTWNQIVAVNQTGTWLGMKAAVPALRRAGGGSIVNISSIFGLIGSGGAAAYQATKGAVRILTKTAAVQYATESIRVNSVHPGVIATPMIDEELPQDALDGLLQATPMGRAGKPEEVAACALFLASDESSYVTGAELVVDGGFTTQ